jgi:hypothetical protein
MRPPDLLHKQRQHEEAGREQDRLRPKQERPEAVLLLVEDILKYLLQQPGNKCIFQSQYGG